MYDCACMCHSRDRFVCITDCGPYLTPCARHVVMLIAILHHANSLFSHIAALSCSCVVMVLVNISMLMGVVVWKFGVFRLFSDVLLSWQLKTQVQH